MKDGFIRRVVKRLALLRYDVDLRVTRLMLSARGEPHYKLAGSCNGCGKCCETPVVQASTPFFRVRSLRWLALWWHRVVNGFELVDEDRRFKLFVFRCTHYDPVTKLCDSYDSRPGMCRDYPRNLLYSPLPEFPAECGYYAVYKKAAQLRQSLERANLPPEKVQELVEKLRLKE